MSKYIASEYLENLVDYYLGHSNGAEHYAFGVMRGELRVAPAADVVEVKHSYWRIVDEHRIDCPECCFNRVNIKMPLNYCPNCGAKMDKEET